MPSVLAIEPQPDRAARLQAVAGPHVRESLTLVHSIDDAFAAIERNVPEVILISPLMPPAEEAELMARLRALPSTQCVQTLITPDLAQPFVKAQRRFIRRPKQAAADASEFGSQLKTYLDFIREERVERTRYIPGSVERRRARREAAEHLAILVDGVRARLMDRSATGVQIVSPTILVPGRYVEVVLEDGSQLPTSCAAVVWGTSDGTEWAESGCRAGLHFVDGPPFESGAVDEPGTSASVRIVRPKSTIDRAARLSPGELPGVSAIRLPGDTEACLLNLSKSGVLVETPLKFLPGSRASIQLCRPGDDAVVVEARFVRSEIAAVGLRGVRYRTAAVFENEVDVERLRARSAQLDATASAVADWLTTLGSELSRGADPDALRRRMKDGLTALLSTGDVDIRREPIPAPAGRESIFFTIAREGDHKAVLQVTFDEGHTPSARDFRILRAASALGAVLFGAS